MKFPDIVKLNTCMLFYDYFHHEKFPDIPVSLESELYNYNTCSASSNQVVYPHLELISGDSAPVLLDVSLGIVFRN